jgi:hypothetical protein
MLSCSFIHHAGTRSFARFGGLRYDFGVFFVINGGVG